MTESLRTAAEVRRRLRAVADPEKAHILSRFFKTGRGEYGEGDRFLGVRVPESRRLARAAGELPLNQIRELLRSPLHEERLVGLLIIVRRFERSPGEAERRRLFRFYVKNFPWVNNWDLVDGSAPAVLGGYLYDKDKNLLREWVRSKNLWRRRAAILATLYFTKRGSFEETLDLARILKDDGEDLIHKAVGWMLREVGKKDRRAAEKFLKENYRGMPRTMLRYAIERFPESRRRAYLRGAM